MSEKNTPYSLTRRGFLHTCTQAAGALTLGQFVTGCAPSGALVSPARTLDVERGEVIDLTIARTSVLVGGKAGDAMTINGGIPGPELRLREGQDVVLRVHNATDETTSIHWHGLYVPYQMDGVPGVSFEGIAPGTTFEYAFPIVQSGTYWYHSHSDIQEQLGVYGAIVIEPAEAATKSYDREYTIVLSDWTFENPHRVLRNLKRSEGYYNFQRRTLATLGRESRQMGGVWEALKDRMSWARMRMDSTDLADVTGITYTYLMNGLAPAENWRGLFTPGERVRLRFINASAVTFFDVRIPGLPMTIVEADGTATQPVEVDEFRIAIAETYDVIVEPKQDAYTIFAETMDRSGYARGTLATTPQAEAALPERRTRPLLTMRDMGMKMEGMNMEGMGEVSHGAMASGMVMQGDESMATSPLKTHGQHDTHDSMTSPTSQPAHKAPTSQPSPAMAACESQIHVTSTHTSDEHGAGNTMVAEVASTRVDDPGLGLRDMPWRVLTYSQLRSTTPAPVQRPPDRTVELHLTGNMERYVWSFDGEQFSFDMPHITLKKDERVRFVLINDTMMAHPIHLHGVLFELEVGHCAFNPIKHTVNVQPAERATFIFNATEVGTWAFHCHVLYHMDSGMFRVVEVLP